MHRHEATNESEDREFEKRKHKKSKFERNNNEKKLNNMIIFCFGSKKRVKSHQRPRRVHLFVTCNEKNDVHFVVVSFCSSTVQN